MEKAVEKVNLINYINWLELFTELESSFYDDTYLYRNDKIKEAERGNAAKLEYFYKELDKLLKEENVKPVTDNYQTYHCINYHDISYEIGYMTGPETIYFCRRKEEKTHTPVDFSILQKKIQK